MVCLSRLGASTRFVGQVGDAAALGGLTVGALVFDFAFATCSFIRTGTTGLAAQAHGAGEVREVQAVFFRAAILAFGIGIALILFEPLITAAGLLAVSPAEGVAETVESYVFIRMISAPFALLNYAVLGTVLGLGRAGLGLGLQIVVNGVNIALSVLFGLVFGWGIAGVALGTVCGEAAGALVEGDANRRAPTAARVIHGPDKVARFLLGLATRYGCLGSMARIDSSRSTPSSSPAWRRR